MEQYFEFEVQMAGYGLDQFDKKGAITCEAFLQEFEQFPWLEQLAYSLETQKGVAATLNVTNTKSDLTLWVSIAGRSKEEAEFIVGYIYPKEIKRFFGLLSPRQGEWLEMYITKDKEVVKECFRLFFEEKIDELESKIRKLDLMDEMECSTKR